MTSARGLREKVESLLLDELWDSAETLGGLLATSTGVDGCHPGERAAHVALFADALLGKREFRRALHHYARALELNRLAPHLGVLPETKTPAPMGTRPFPESPTTQAPTTPGIAAASPAIPMDTPVAKLVPTTTHPSHLDEANTKFKMGKCYACLREWRLALSELETIPARERTLPVTLALAEAYRRTGYDRASLACYKECLRINPFAVEAIDALADAGVDVVELRAHVFPENANDTTQSDSHTVLRLLLEGRSSLVAGDVRNARAHYEALSRAFPGDARVTLALARIALANNDKDAALDHFRRRRGVDPRAVEGADLFAELLRSNREEGEGDDVTSTKTKTLTASAHDVDDEFGLGGYGVLSGGYGLGGCNACGADGELRELVRDSLEANTESPESWIAAAVYWSARGHVTKALGYADKALRLDDLKKTAHLTRGHLCLRLRRPEDAVVSFRRAVGLIDGPSSLDKSKKKIKSSTSNAPGGSMIGTHALVTPRAGLVASYLLQRRRKEALASAKEALACAPRSANAHALMGDAYLARGTMNAQVAVGVRTTADTKSRAEKAKKHFKTALQIDPGNARFALALSEACRLCGEADAAAACLRELLEGHAGGSNETNVRVACHCALGAVLASQRMLADAAGEYQKASGLDPDNDGARRGIARVERLMKGQDPDATEPDEDGDDDEDEDGEDEDGEDEDGDEEFE